MRVRVAESTLVHDLLDFLRRCGFEVERASADLIDVQLHPEVSVEVMLSFVRDSRCYGCGGQISDVLAKLGSALCHDCRDKAAATRHTPQRSLDVDWARMELDACLRVWCAQHATAGVDVLDADLGRQEVA